MSTSGKNPHPPLGEQAVREYLRFAIDRSYYEESDHASDDHPERNISIDDVVHGLEREDWAFERQPCWDSDYECWKYYIKTVDIEGEELVVVLRLFPQSRRFRIITRW